MANLSFLKTTLEPRPNLPPGMLRFIFTGFKPKLSKKQEGKEQSINLNPQIKIVENPNIGPDNKPLNGQPIFENLNLKFVPRIQDFCHALGCAMTENGENVDIPGYFDGDTNNPDPAQWGAYHGPLLNEVGTVELAEVKSRKAGAKPTDTQTDIKRYICRVPGCTVNHMESLLQS